MKLSNFRGELTDISAKKDAVTGTAAPGEHEYSIPIRQQITVEDLISSKFGVFIYVCYTNLCFTHVSHDFKAGI